MLKQLRISNYAIINEADIRFSESMNIITGETGAGKSILLGALSLILGERANTGVLFNKEKKCVVEGVFQIGNYHLNDFFIDNEIDYEEETIIRRELTDNGKSRAFINDTPVNLQILQSLADKLITVHSQHETMALGESAFQLMVIDALAETGALRKTCKEQFLQWKNCSQRLKETEALSAKALIEKDFIEFQFAELDQAGLDAIDQTALENEHTQLTHAVEIKQQLSSAVEMLENGPSNIIDNLHHVIAQLQSIVKYAPDIESYIQRLSSSVIELKDIVRDLEDKEEAVSADPKRTEDIQQQLNILFRLQKKHHCNTIEALIILRDELGVKLSAYINSEETIALLKKEQTKLFSQVASTAKKILNMVCAVI